MSLKQRAMRNDDMRCAEFVVPLVKAVQGQQKLIEELTSRIEELEKK